MKTPIFLSLLLCLSSAVAQTVGPSNQVGGNLPLPVLQFEATLSGANQVPPNSSTATGHGTYTLEAGPIFRGWTRVPFAPFYPTAAAIHGSADAGENGPVLFELAGPFFIAPLPPNEPGGFSFHVERTLTTEETMQLIAGRWYVNIRSASFPEGEIRGQILPPPADGDGDGVPNASDQCSDTAPGTVVNAQGCGLAQLCPKEAAWKNRGQYVRFVQRTAIQFQRAGQITRAERRAFVRDANHSFPRKK